jgi:DNA (cytosine-5)-methyltransferase 1
MIKAVDLFAGCGGLSCGFQNAGISVKAAFEFWNVAAEVYEKNFDHPVFQIDLSNVANAVSVIRPFHPDMIIGGPPCQDFSHAGKRIEAERAGLTGSFANIVKEVRPAYFVMENVDRAEKSNAYAYARQTFKDAGYGLTEIVLDASYCGVPQKRKRFFCIGVLDAEDNAVRPFITQKISDHETTLRDYFGSSLGFEFYYRHPRNYSRRAVFSIDEPAPTMRGVNRPVPKGYPGHPNDACPVGEGVRALTTQERALIQTFPVDFKWDGSKTDMEQMIGNAVPVKLAEFVARAVIDYIQGNHQEEITTGFAEWLVSEKGYSERVSKDIVSRSKRAEKLVPSHGCINDYYLFTLEQNDAFQQLSVNVRSQIKRAVQLLLEYSQRA